MTRLFLSLLRILRSLPQNSKTGEVRTARRYNLPVDQQKTNQAAEVRTNFNDAWDKVSRF